MISLSRTVEIALVTTSLVLSRPTTGKEIPFTIEISSKQKSIRVGDPLTFKLVYRFEQPFIRSMGPKGSLTHYAYLAVEHDGQSFRRFPIFPSDLKLQDKQGLEYTGQFVFLYHPGERRLIFPEPSTYKITVYSSTKVSNLLNLTVEAPSELQRRALSLLSDPNDYFFLEHGEHEYPEKHPERISHLQQVVEHCEGTVLAKWAAARLGLEYFQEFHKKHPSFEKFKAKHQQGQIEEPLFDQASKYLTAGAELRDEFPIRENVVAKLVNIEFMDGNYEKAFSLLDELSTKYPDGEYGKKAAGGKEELIELQRRELAQAPQPRVSGWSRLLTLFLVIAAGIVLIGLILVLKKKPSSRGKSRAT